MGQAFVMRIPEMPISTSFGAMPLDCRAAAAAIVGGIRDASTETSTPYKNNLRTPARN